MTTKQTPERIYIQNPFSSGNATSGTWFTDNRKTDKTEYIRADLSIPRADVMELAKALDELTDLMQGVIDGDYKPDSFTLQPAKQALTNWSTKYGDEVIKQKYGEDIAKS